MGGAGLAANSELSVGMRKSLCFREGGAELTVAAASQSPLLRRLLSPWTRQTLESAPLLGLIPVSKCQSLSQCKKKTGRRVQDVEARLD